MKSILDRAFKYTNSAETDLRKTFARVRREKAALERGSQVETTGAPAAAPIRLNIAALPKKKAS